MEHTNDSQNDNFNQDNQEQAPIESNEAQENQEMQEDNLSFKNRIDLSELQEGVELIKNEISKVIVGQKGMIDMLIASILANGHSLIEGVPGVAKTI